MIWTHYIAAFFSGMFLANALPHFVKGLCGDRFPTPFAKPPGIGLSSAMVNTLWGLLNILIGAVLFHTGRVQSGSLTPLIIFFAGVVVISVMLSNHFPKKHSS